MHRTTLDRARADERDLGHEVVKAAWAQSRQGTDLCPTLDLEDTDRVGMTQHVVDALLLLRDAGEGPALPQMRRRDVEGVLDGAEHAEPEQVELHQAHPGTVVLVPLQHGAVIHAGTLDRHHLRNRTIGENHSARMDAQMSWRLQQSLGEIDHRRRNVVIGTGDDRSPRVDLLRPRILLTSAVPESLRHVTDSRLRPVRDDVRDLGGVTPTVLVVDILDDLFAPVGIEVDVDVGLLFTCRRQEALERQIKTDRVNGGDAKRVADSGVCRGSPALAEDSPLLRVRDDVVHDEEVPGKAELLDDRELALEPVVYGCVGVRVELLGAATDELAQPCHRCVAGWHVLARQPRPCRT